MRLTTTIEGYEAYIDIADVVGEYRVVVPALRETASTTPKFNSVDAAARAIKAYDLAQRKGFGNPTAYIEWGNKLEEVRVTSVSADGKDAWIVRYDGRREKVTVKQLFADAGELGAILAAWQDARDEHWRRMSAAKRWAPEFVATGAA